MLPAYLRHLNICCCSLCLPLLHSSALQLWQLTTRFWEGWKVPASRMFEVGMVVEI
jgi:hypothetical protein